MPWANELHRSTTKGRCIVMTFEVGIFFRRKDFKTNYFGTNCIWWVILVVCLFWTILYLVNYYSAVIIYYLKTCFFMNGKLMLILSFEELFILFLQASDIDQTGPQPGLKLLTDRVPALLKVCDMTGKHDWAFHMNRWWMFNIHSQWKAQTSENLLPFPAKPDQPKTTSPTRPPAPLVDVNGRPVIQKEEPTLANLQAEIKELRMALELLQRQHEWELFLIIFQNMYLR